MNSSKPVRTDEPQTNEAPARKRRYMVPRVTVHGTVAELTLGKTGNTPDVDVAGGSFTNVP